ncbi:hypothetical protein [Candidatus Thiodictyon syntrophicum]|jgi:hypothetical protein|uniref:Uncharacterized protein n=1 Tax=Candidatus Thiodictyon syntrophicum TaxID=1166950 RepID=A0A2K8U8G8_9GAMM|nr:hypothetical protein [Candidatus Thiodictyon syntrophicum]AUB81847.1 hypothetical protein THSYN_13330 [Candidatus Thiodictyon syntrophicum]
MKKRNTCRDAACLNKVYSQRVAELAREGAPAAPGSSQAADQRSLPVGKQADIQDAGEAIRIGAVSDAAMVSGCSCTVNPVLANGKIDAGRCILFDDFSDVTIKLEKGARRQRIQGKAVCGFATP